MVSDCLGKIYGFCFRYLTKNIVLIALFFVGIASGIWLIHINKTENLPALSVSLVAAYFSYWACLFTREKFRLDLLDKRWQIYEKVLEFCSRVTQEGTLHMRLDNEDRVRAAILAAEEGFRGIGYHKAKSLFGGDILELYERLNKAYAEMRAFGGIRPREPGYERVPQMMHDHVIFIMDTVNKLPKHFKPYIYFGDYRRD